MCEIECPALAIIPDTQDGAEKWLELNRKYSSIWPNITTKGEPPSDADAWLNVPNKYNLYFEDNN